MPRNGRSGGRWLAAVVLGHLLLSIAHGAAHNGANVPMSLAAVLFIGIVIVAGPLIGVALAWRDERLGRAVVALTLAGSFVFGIANHFLLQSPDHVSHIDLRWRMLFASTAILLAATEAVGCALAIVLSGERRTS